MKEKCENCKFYKNKDGSKEEGECRRYPRVVSPRIVGVAFLFSSTEAYCFPDVSYDEWCGEYAAASEGLNL